MPISPEVLERLLARIADEVRVPVPDQVTSQQPGPPEVAPDWADEANQLKLGGGA